jgi:hypothetical protein
MTQMKKEDNDPKKNWNFWRRRTVGDPGRPVFASRFARTDGTKNDGIVQDENKWRVYAMEEFCSTLFTTSELLGAFALTEESCSS